MMTNIFRNRFVLLILAITGGLILIGYAAMIVSLVTSAIDPQQAVNDNPELEHWKRELAAQQRETADNIFALALLRECDPVKRSAMQAAYQQAHPDWRPPSVQLLASRNSPMGEWEFSEGQIKNVTAKPMSGLKVIVEWYTNPRYAITASSVLLGAAKENIYAL
jgi:hypothetical protein